MYRRFIPASGRLARLLLAACLLVSLFSTASRTAAGSEDLAGPGPHLVKDIQTMNESSFPYAFTAVGNAFYFTTYANDMVYGSELWRSEGTPETTKMVVDLTPGPEGSYPAHLSRLDDTHLVFTTSDSLGSTRLWVSDGTAEGTQPLTEAAAKTYLEPTISMDGLVYLIESTADGNRLWRTDGTTEGTIQVSDLTILCDICHEYNLNPRSWAAFSGWLYFTAQGPQGIELYRTSRAVMEPELVKDLCVEECGSGTISGAGSSSPGGLVAAPDRLYFIAGDDTHGKAIWYTNGTAGNVALVADILPGVASGEGYSNLAPAGGGLYFTATDGNGGSDLWFSAGAPDTAQQVMDLEGYQVLSMAPLGSTVFINVRSNSNFSHPAVYKTNGTTAQRLEPDSLYAWNFIQIDTALYAFGSVPSDTGDALWKFTEDAPPQRISPRLSPFVKSQYLIVWKDRLIFSAGDSAHAFELWMSDGTAAGTGMLADLNQQTDARGSRIEALSAIYQDSVYFTAISGLKFDTLWRSDGTADGTQQVKEFSNSLPPIEDAVVSNGLLYFSQGYGGLWRTDGTADGTLHLLDGYPRRLMDADGKLFFVSNNYDLSQPGALWVINKGDPAPVELLEPLSELQLGVLGGDCLLVTWAGDGWDLIRSDGTVEGTHVIYHRSSAGAYYPGYPYNDLPAMTVVNGRAFFIAPSETPGYAFALYATDGVTVTPITGAPGVDGTPLFPTKLLVVASAVGNTLYFSGANVTSTGEMDAMIWKVAAGSSQAEVVFTGTVDLPQFSMSLIPEPLADLNGKLVFSASRPGVVGPLLQTDGTPGQAAPICPGCLYSFSYGSSAVASGGKLYFRAADPVHGSELWVSNGTDAGTRLMADIRPGPDSASPDHLLILGQRLLFTATDGVEAGVGHGTELWGMDLLAHSIYLPEVGSALP